MSSLKEKAASEFKETALSSKLNLTVAVATKLVTSCVEWFKFVFCVRACFFF